MKNKTSILLLVGLMMVLSISLASAQVFYEDAGTIYCPDASPGDTGLVGGVTYTAYDTVGLFDVRTNQSLLETACTSLVTSFNPSKTLTGGLFYGSSLNPNITHWDTSNVVDMSDMFFDVQSFNQDISGWDTSNVNDMSSMFFQASSFNQDLNEWNTSSVTDMESMFQGATSFNGSIGAWDTSGVTDMESMFMGATLFNRDISGWDTGKVKSMKEMFWGMGNQFNQPIGDWDVSSVTNMGGMFNAAGGVNSFNQNISGWDVSKVTDMSGLFIGAPFNQDISSWCVLNIGSKPSHFDTSSGFLGQDHLQPQWGTCGDYAEREFPVVKVGYDESDLFSDYSVWINGEEYEIIGDNGFVLEDYFNETNIFLDAEETIFEKDGFLNYSFPNVEFKMNKPPSSNVFFLEYPSYFVDFVVPSNSTYGVNQSTTVSVDVTCTQGDCNNISFYLDPIGEGLVVTDAWGYMMMFSGDLSGAYNGNWIGFMSGGDEGTCWQSDRIYDFGGSGEVRFFFDNHPQNVAVGDTFNVYSDEASCLSGFGKGVIPEFVDWVDEAFYTTSSNPQVVSIPFGETMTLTWTINSTQLGDDFEFFVLHNSSGFVDFRQSQSWFVNVSEVISGCTDSEAINFDPDADFDNGMCYYMLGCTDSLAINFDPDADMDDGTCEYAEEEPEPTPTPSRGGGGSSVVEESREVEVEESEAESKLEGVLGDGLGLNTTQKFIVFTAVAVGAYLLLTPNALSGSSVKAKRGGRRRKGGWF